MTAADLLRASLRRWYLTALGLLVTALVVLSLQPRTVYWTSQVATLEPPTTKLAPKRLGQPSSDPIPTAELLAGLVNRHSDIRRSKNSDATTYGEGLYNMSSARVVNSGNQWVTSITRPSIQIESDASSLRVALDRQQREVLAISTTLQELQSGFDVSPSQRIGLTLTPTQASAVEIRGSRPRACAAFTAIGLVATFWVVYVIERASIRRRRRALGGQKA